ncbi:hypothetical protein Trydic_g18476, partial [Trypoxylus dichotomus]
QCSGKRINYHRHAKIRITQEYEEIKQKIGEIVIEEDFTNIRAAVQRSYTRINRQLQDKHWKQLESLIRQKKSNSVDPRKTVINVSNMILAGKIKPPEAADEYRWKVRTAIEKAKPKQIRQHIGKAK